MKNPLFEKLKGHTGHRVRIDSYITNAGVLYVSIECDTCTKTLELVEIELPDPDTDKG